MQHFAASVSHLCVNKMNVNKNLTNRWATNANLIPSINLSNDTDFLLFVSIFVSLVRAPCPCVVFLSFNSHQLKCTHAARGQPASRSLSQTESCHANDRVRVAMDFIASSGRTNFYLRFIRSFARGGTSGDSCIYSNAIGTNQGQCTWRARSCGSRFSHCFSGSQFLFLYFPIL